jgi:hypothetical protein
MKSSSTPLGDLTKEALYYDYASTANPIFSGLIRNIKLKILIPDCASTVRIR